MTERGILSLATPRPRTGRRGGGGSGESPRSRTGDGSAGVENVQGGASSGEILIDIATAVLLATEVKKAYETLQKMKPRPEEVRKVARKWYEASAHYRKSFDPLKMTTIELGGYWEGRAFDAFEKYMESIVLDTATNISDTLAEIGDAVIDVHNLIVEQYNDGMVAFQDTVTKAIDYHKDLGTLEGDAKKSTRNALHDLLNLWIKDVGDRKRAVFNITEKGAGAMEVIGGKILQIDPPQKAPSVITDKGKWTYG